MTRTNNDYIDYDRFFHKDKTTVVYTQRRMNSFHRNDLEYLNMYLSSYHKIIALGLAHRPPRLHMNYVTKDLSYLVLFKKLKTEVKMITS